VALSDFEALAGFRPAARSVALLRALAVPALDPYIALLDDASDAAGLRALFTTWITAPQPDIDTLISAVLEAAVSYIRSGAKEFVTEAQMVLELGERYPGDAGVLAALLLNRISLSPGQGIFLAAGNLHSYLRGVGMEVMANSDNVLRGGLTPKHVDVAELLRVLDFTPVLDAHVATRSDGIECHYQTPAAEFAASVITLDGADLGHEVDAPSHHDGPQILVCTQGTVTVRAKSGIGETSEVQMDRGSAAWVAADDGPIRLQASGPSALFRATVGV
jgi:mannose-6-phosphate isomerase